MFTEQLSQELSCIDQVNPSNAAAGTVNSAGIDMSKFGRCMYEVQIGAITGAGTLDVKLQSCQYASFNSSVHSMTGGAITQITNASPNTRVTLETNEDAIQAQNNGDRYVRIQCVVTANNVIYGATGWGGEASQKPASAQDNTTVVVQRLQVQ
jgi:hypothetical protein